MDAGATTIDSTLKSDLAQMTTAVPPQFLWQDINTSQTLGPVAVRDSDAPDLGWHYPAIDYVMNGATVNNCTLNIDQGTVLAFVGGPYQWGLRVNAGGRLNINGSPTNRVIFTHLEAVQESPIGYMSPHGPLLTFRDVFFGNRDLPATPFPEARVLYADFPTLCSRIDVPNFPIGPLPSWELPDWATYGCLGSLTLESCLFQGGTFNYEDGGPAGRTLTMRNCVFERMDVGLIATGDYDRYTHTTEHDAQITAANNLFYDCVMKLTPVQENNNWTFTDNIFDHVTFVNVDYVGVQNGPVANNHNNAYVGMKEVYAGDNRLSPAAPTDTDPDLAFLSYDKGFLGRFYLPTTASALINKGSRTAADAGLYHFTAAAANTKEADTMVDIGPHYVALDSSGVPFDSNVGGGDGVPDFIADANGDGAESGEIPWQSQNNSGVAILAPPQGQVGGILHLRVNPGNFAKTALYLIPIVDPLPSASWLGLRRSPSRSQIDLDTRFFPNGSLTLKVRVVFADYNSGRQYSTADSPPVTINVNNQLSFPNWDSWAGVDTAIFNVAVPAGPDGCTIDVFDTAYPKSYEPLPQAHLEGTVSSGAVSSPLPLASCSLLGGDSHPNIFSFATPTRNGTPTAPSQASPVILQDVGFPDIGWWYIAYEDSYTKVYDPDWGRAERPVEDTLQPMSTFTWFTDGALEGWKGLAAWANPTRVVHDPPVNGVSGTWPQTWPIRYSDYHVPVDGHRTITPLVLRDWTLFAYRMADPKFRNLYIGSHMTANDLGIVPADGLFQALQQPSPHRFRFVFLDGCESGASDALPAAFGFTHKECSPSLATPITYYQGLDLQDPVRRRPGAGVVFRTIFDWFVPTPSDPTKAGDIPEEFAQFYIDFQAPWTEYGERLVDAINDARTFAQGKSTYLIHPPWAADCADTIGFQNLHYNDFNSGADTW